MENLIGKWDWPKIMRIGCIAVVLTLMFTEPGAAQDFSGVQSFLDKIVKAITGPIGIAVSGIAVMAVGFSFMTGRMDWTFAVSILLGIAIVFGAATFVSSIAAS
jgi:type IV secretion system protein VirB2